MNPYQFEGFIKNLIEPLGIDCVTLYTPDPWGLDDNYRLLWMYGVRDEAPMFGPVQPEARWRRLFDQPERSLCFSTVKRSDLFHGGGFVEREGTVSLIRCDLLI